MRKNTPNNAHINSIPDDLNSVWQEAGKLKRENVVTERETETALKNIWAKVDYETPSKKFSFIPIGIAAAIVITALSSFLSFYSVQKISPAGELTEITLPDGSEVILNGNSSIEYSLLFGFTNREIKLNGQARFDVERNEEIAFQITSPNLTTTVLGTIFEIEDWNDAKTTSPSVYVHEGKVEVKNNESIVTLNQDQKTQLIEESLVEIQSIDMKSDHVINWTDSRVTFTNIPLSQFFERLSFQFDTNIQIESSISDDEKVSGSYRLGTRLDQIISDISMIKDLEYQMTNNGFVIR